MLFYETKRLLVRPLTENDLAPMVEMLRVWDVAKWLVFIPHPFTWQDALTYLARVQAARFDNIPAFLVIEGRAEQRMIGGISLAPLYLGTDEAGGYEAGYWLGQRYWGQGYASEALEGLLAYLKRFPQLQKLRVYTDIENKASHRVLEKAGFTALGVLARNKPHRLRGSQTVATWDYSFSA